MIKKLFSVAAAAVLSVSAVPITVFADDPDFTQKDITAHVYSQDNLMPLASRFYNDLPEVPYVRLNDYYSLLLDRELEIEADGAVFNLKNPFGDTAVIDTDADVLTSDDLSEFINTTVFRKDNVNNIYYDGMPFVKVAGVQFDKEALPSRIDFAGYGIDLRADDGELWVPFITASDLFKSVTMISSFYTGEEYYFVDDNADYSSTDTSWTEPFYKKAVGCFFKDGKRSPETAQFGYSELCFAIDTFYGLPGQAMIHDALKNSSSFNEALETLDKEADGIVGLKDLLLSEEADKFEAGIYMLNLLFYDGGHMGFDMAFTAMQSTLDTETDNIGTILAMTGYDLLKPEESRMSKFRSYIRIDEAREKVLGTENYHKEGNTAFYSFDSFLASAGEWQKYYAGEGERPNDELSGLLDAMKKADEDPEIKNFIIDLSYNGGGSGDIVAAIMQLISGKSYISFYNTLSGQTVTTNYDIDANFDGVFDEKDKEKQYDLNFGVLTSELAFSCGNLLPALCKENGIPLFGDKTGGGACAVYMCTTPECLPYRMSSNVHLVDKNGQSIDAGIEPDYQMLAYAEDGSRNYEQLYDLAAINAKMNELYPEEEESTPAESETSSQTGMPDTTPATGAAYAGSAIAVIMIAVAVGSGKREHQ